MVVSDKYEVVIGVPDDEVVNGKIENQVEKMINKWQEFAKEYFDVTGVYVSAIANEGKAIYHKDWGCPDGGERTITFNCSANRRFIKDLYEYGKGVLYITGKMKREFKQHTITITGYRVDLMYYTDENNKEFDERIKEINKRGGRK